MANNNVLEHHGILGMKWGVRRYQNKDGSLTARGKARARQSDDEDTKQEAAKKSVKNLSDDELRRRISRLELERRYVDLSTAEQKRKISKGKAFVMNVLEKSGQSVASQITTYAIGTAANKLIGKDIVNVKKLQEDK